MFLSNKKSIPRDRKGVPLKHFPLQVYLDVLKDLGSKSLVETFRKLREAGFKSH